MALGLYLSQLQRPRFVFESHSVWISAGTLAILMEALRVFSQSLQASACTSIRRLGYDHFLPSSLQIIYSLITLQFQVV